jgi:hypothetical protein
MEAGSRLIEAKTLVPHGGWLPWLRDNCDISERTAQLYMKLAKNKVAIDAKSATVADLGIRGAIAEITRLMEPESDIDPRDCLPPSGHIAIGQGRKGEQLWVVPSHQHPGHLYVTLLEDDGSGGSHVKGTSRPVRSDWVPFMVRQLLPAGKLEWQHDLGAPWAFNIWLFQSPRAYVESITSPQTLADIAHGRPPSYPDIDDDVRAGLSILQNGRPAQ